MFDNKWNKNGTNEYKTTVNVTFEILQLKINVSLGCQVDRRCISYIYMYKALARFDKDGKKKKEKRMMNKGAQTVEKSFSSFSLFHQFERISN